MAQSAFEQVGEGNHAKLAVNLSKTIEAAVKHMADKVRTLAYDRHGNELQLDPGDIDNAGLIEDIREQCKEGFADAVRIMNEDLFALENDGGKAVIGYYRMGEFGTPELTLQYFKEFVAIHVNRKVLIDLKVMPRAGRVEYVYKNLTELWLTCPERRSYESMTLDPSTTDIEVNGMFNAWKGLDIEPRQGDWRLMKRHIWEVLANRRLSSYRYIMRWMAWSLQNPGELAETAICFVGDQGTGKTTVGRWMLKMFGTHGFRPQSQRQVTGNFNAVLRDKCFLLMDEALNPENKTAANILKGYITDERSSFEPKGREMILAKNRLKFMFMSNNDHFLNIEEGDRRYAAFRVSSDHKQEKSYFQRLYAQANDEGGIDAMAHDLLNMRLGGWHPREGIPKTEERRKQQALSLYGIDLLIHHLLATGDLPDTEGDPFHDAEKDIIERWASTAALIQLAKREFRIQINGMHLHHNIRLIGAQKKRVGSRNGWLFQTLRDSRVAWVETGKPFDFEVNKDKWSYSAARNF